VNSQHYNNPLEPIDITKCGQICITALIKSSSHGKIMIPKDMIVSSQQITYRAAKKGTSTIRYKHGHLIIPDYQ
jgi:hypothetical protein